MKSFYENLYKQSKKSYFKYLEDILLNNEKKFIITANPETFSLGIKNNEIGDMLINKNNSVVADGIGISASANMLGYEIKERIPGVDVTEYLFKLCDKYKKSICILGSKEEVLNELKEVFKEKYKNAKILDFTNGYIDSKDEHFDKIKKLKPDVVIVALGIPNQELLINKHIKDFESGIFIGVGGSLDVLSGNKKRAPKFFIKLNIEWLYRIICEPSRIKRFYQNNIKFGFKVLFNLKKWRNKND